MKTKTVVREKIAALRSRMGFALVLCTWSCSVFGAEETLGLWVFNGTPGTTVADGTSFPNLVSGSAMTLVSGSTNTAGNTVYQPKYVEDTPGYSLYSEINRTTRLATITSSLLLTTGSVSSVSSYLRIPQFGKFVGNGDFTVEMIYKPLKSDGQVNLLAGISGRDWNHSPAVGISGFNTGSLFAKTNNTPNAINGAGSKAGITHQWLDNCPFTPADTWQSLTLVYIASQHKWQTSCRPTLSKSERKAITPSDGSGCFFNDDSFFQILGHFDQIDKAYPGIILAALRVTKGTRANTTEHNYCMRVSPDYMTDTPCAWWRFEGAVGQTFTTVSNSAMMSGLDAAWCADTYAALNRQTATRDYSYSAAEKPFVREGKTAPYALANASGGADLGDMPTANASGGFIPKCGRSGGEFLYEKGDFTVECFCKLTGRTDSGRQLLFGEMMTAVSYQDKFSWIARTMGDSKRFELDWILQDVETGEFSSWATCASTKKIWSDDDWHHVAVTYDLEKRKIELFVDYESCGSATHDATKSLAWGKSRWFACFGYGGPGITRPWCGNVDELRIHRRVLKTDEFLRLRTRQVGEGLILFFR